MKKHIRAFTLVEIVIAMAIVATGLIAIVGLIPVGLKASRESATRTVTAIILEDLHNRLEGNKLQAGDISGSPFFYDDQGLFIPSPAEGDDLTDEELLRRNYRAELRLVDIDPKNEPVNTGGLKAIIIELYWPVKPVTGEPMGAIDPATGRPEPRTSVTYYLTTLTGPEWEVIDPTYEPKIEF